MALGAGILKVCSSTSGSSNFNKLSQKLVFKVRLPNAVNLDKSICLSTAIPKSIKQLQHTREMSETENELIMSEYK